MTGFQVHKFVLSAQKEQEINLPQNAEILSVEFQRADEGGAQLCLWAMVMLAQPMVARRLVMVDTGEPLTGDFVEKHQFLKTLQMVSARQDDQGTVFHKIVVSHLFINRETTTLN